MRYGINDPFNRAFPRPYYGNPVRSRGGRTSRAQYVNAMRAEHQRRQDDIRRRQEALRQEEALEAEPESSPMAAHGRDDAEDEGVEAPAHDIAPVALTTSVADYVDEAKRRIERASRADVEQQRRAILRDMLVVYDDLERTLEATQANMTEDSEMTSLVSGITIVRDRFVEKLAKHGARPIDSDNAAFDPLCHEAIGTTSVEPEREGLVLHTIRRGFRIGEELLRPAQVMVGKAS